MRIAALGIVLPVTALALALVSPPAGAAVTTSAPAVPPPDQVPPVVVVLDLSGSMNDDDGSGLIKLTGAKTAVDDVIRSIPASQPFGLWTFPSGSDDCSSGAFTIPPARITDRTGTIEQADSLTADGGTPTGPALHSAADALTAAGTTTATLVLVSDGESNCGENPCDVAKELVSQGFDVTIHSVGFRVSEPGRQELNCVASATGGTYVDVANSVQLNKTLQELTRAKLRIQTSGAPTLALGGLGSIEVTVTNPSAVSASDVQLFLQFAVATPTNVNTLLRAGNVPPGKSVTRVWTIGASTPGTTPTTGRRFTVSAWAKNADRVTVGGIVGGPGSQSPNLEKNYLKDYLGDWLKKPVDAGHPIVIIGDSYSAGEGTFSYLKPPQKVSAGCHRSDKTYLMPVLDPGDVVNLACSGAVTWDFYYPGRDGTPPQSQQLAELEHAPSAVVLTLGGNDIGFADIVRQCVEHDCDVDQKRVAAWEGAADSLRTWLAPVYEDVWKTINLPERRDQRGGTLAPVVVLAYPQVTHATKYGACGRLLGYRDTLGAGEVKVANNLVAHLNAALKAAVADARDAGYEIYFVPDTADVMLPNHTICDGSDAWVNGVLLKPAAKVLPIDAEQESVHPNVSGYGAETAAIIAWSATVTPQPPKAGDTGPVASAVSRPPWSLWTFDTAEIGFYRQATVDGSLFSGAPVQVSGAGYAPGTPVIIMIHSTPAVLGTLVAGVDGQISGQVHLPEGLELGKHEVVAAGTNANGTYRESSVAVSVLAPPPLWTQVALVACGALLVTAAVLLAMWKIEIGAPGGRMSALLRRRRVSPAGGPA